MPLELISDCSKFMRLRSRHVRLGVFFPADLPRSWRLLELRVCLYVYSYMQYFVWSLQICNSFIDKDRIIWENGFSTSDLSFSLDSLVMLRRKQPNLPISRSTSFLHMDLRSSIGEEDRRTFCDRGFCEGNQTFIFIKWYFGSWQGRSRHFGFLSLPLRLQPRRPELT